MSNPRTDLPSVKSPNFEQRIRETLMTYLGRQGDPLDRGLTLRDLIENGIVKIRNGYRLGPGSGSGVVPIEAAPPEELDLTPPPQPTGFAVNSAISHVFIEHDAPLYRQGGGHLRTRVYGVTRLPTDPLPVFADAVEITQFSGNIHAHPSNPSTTWRLWIKWETRANVLSASPAGGTNGLMVRTGEDVALLLAALQGQIRESHLFNALGERINLIDGSGIGSVNNRIQTEAAARTAAIVAEQGARAAAIAVETQARHETIAVESRQRLSQAQASGEAALGAVLAAHNENTARTHEVRVVRQELAAVSDQSVAAIQSEVAARTTADLAEATERNLLATQLRGSYTGNDLNQTTTGLIHQERVARSLQDQALAQQITLLSAGAGEQFDWQTIWYFDAGTEGWTGAVAPTAAGGWLRPGNQASGAGVDSPAGVAADGLQYGQARLRIRRTGAPVFAGFLWWRAAGDATWDVARRVALAAPTFDANGIGLITVSPTWPVVVDRIRVELSAAQTATDFFEIDWVAIGRPSPGASLAQVLSEQQARATAVLAEATARETLSSSLIGRPNPSGATLANITEGLLFDERTARVNQDQAITSSVNALSATVTSNQNAVNASILNESNVRAFADNALAENVSAVQSRLTNAEGGIGSLTSSVQGLEQTVATAGGTAAQTALTLRSASQAQDTDAETALRNTVAGHAASTQAEQATALARQELGTQIREGISAEAQARSLLSAQVNQNTAALVNESSIRATADSALSTQINTLTASAAGNAAAIQTETTARTNADTALSQQLTTLAATVTGNNTAQTAALQTESSTRATADTALSQQLTTLAATVTGNNTAQTAALQVESQARASVDGGLLAQFTVKTDVNGYVSGFGLASSANNSVPTSAFVARADSFSIANPAGPSIAPAMPFIVRTTPTTINGVAVPAGVYMTDTFVQNGTITNAKIGNLAVDDAKVANLSASKIAFGQMSGERIEVGTLDANAIRTGTLLATTSLIADSGTGRRVTISGDGRVESDGPSRRTVMDAGDVISFIKVAGVGEVPYKALANVQVGVTQNGVAVVIPGFFSEQPRVLVSPAELGVFDRNFASQSQTLVCSTGAVTQVPGSAFVWQFTPTATLSLHAAEVGTAINTNSGGVSGDSFTTTTRQAPGNTSRLEVQMQFLSVRRTATVGEHAFRRVVWRLQWSLDQVSWSDSPQTTVTIGQNTSNFIGSTIAINLPSAAAWFWRAVCVASDAGGVFNVGGTQFEFGSDVISRSDFVRTELFGSSGGTNTASVNYNIPYALPSGWEVTGVSGTLIYSIWSTWGNFMSASVVGPGVNRSFGGLSSGTHLENNTAAAINTFSNLTYTLNTTADGNSWSTMRFDIHSASVTVQRRRALSQAAGTTNHFNLVSSLVRLNTARVLATGSLNWMAVGQ